MTIGCRVICVFAVLINKVSLQVSVEAVTGGSVVLPCSSTERGLKAQDTEVHWRHNGSENVYEIIKGEDSVERQDPRYKNRVETLPLEYERGNFSIKLYNLTHGDSGEFSCIVKHASEFLTVQLIIKEKSTAEKERTSTEQDQTGETESDNVDPSLNWVYIVITVLILTISIGIFICFYYKRKKQAASFSSVRTEDKKL